MKKLVSLTLAVVFVLTLFTAIPVSAVAVTEAEDFKVEASDFVCGPYDRGEWGPYLSASSVDTGALMNFTPSGAGNQISMAYGTKVDLNGAHFKLTLADDTSHRYTGIWINSYDWNSPTSDHGLYIKSTNNGERQFQIGVLGFGDGQAIDHSVYEYCYPGRTDRLFLPDSLTSGSINEYEYRFSKNIDGSFTLTFNGYPIILSAETIAAANIDTENVYIHFNSMGESTKYVVNYVHGGGENCTALANELNAIAATTAKQKVNLYAKSQGLGDNAAALVENYADYVSAAYEIKDVDYYKVSESQMWPKFEGGFAGWASLIGRTEAEDGVNVAYSQAVLEAYATGINKACAVDGMEFSFTLDSADYYNSMIFVKLQNDCNNGPSALTIKFDRNGGQLFFSTAGGSVDHSKMTGFNGSYPDRTFPSSVVNGDILKYTFKLNVVNGALVININGTDFVIGAEDFAKSGLNLNAAYLILAPISGAPNFTVHYVKSGKDITFDNIADSRYYKMTTADIKDHGWDGIDKTDTEDGLNIKYSVGYTYIYTQWVDKAVSIDGLKLAYTINSSGYYDRIMHVGLQGTDQTNPDIASTPLNIQLEPGWVRIKIKGNAITSADYSYAPFDTTNMIIPCSDLVSTSVNRYEFAFASESNGGLSIYLNDVKLVTLSAAQVAETGLDTGKARVKFAPAESFPADQSSFIDYTIHYIKSGDITNKTYFDKPVAVDGDANADGEVNVLDLIRAKKYSSGDAVSVFVAAADLSDEGDGIINAIDISALKKILLADF